MGNGTAGGLRHHQQWSPSWPPSWILPRIRNQVKTVRNGDFFVPFLYIYTQISIFLATRPTFIVERSWKNIYFHPKMAWAPATYDVISRDHSNWLVLNLSQNVHEGWTNSYWKRQVLISSTRKKLRKTSWGRGGWHPSIHYLHTTFSVLLILGA